MLLRGKDKNGDAHGIIVDDVEIYGKKHGWKGDSVWFYITVLVCKSSIHTKLIDISVIFIFF